MPRNRVFVAFDGGFVPDRALLADVKFVTFADHMLTSSQETEKK